MRSGRFRFWLTDPDDISNFPPPSPRASRRSAHPPRARWAHPWTVAASGGLSRARVGGSGHQDGPRGNARAALLHNGGYATCLSSQSPARSGAPLLALACRQMTGISRNRALCKPGVPSAPASCRWHFAGPLPAARCSDLQVFTHLAVVSAHSRRESAPNIACSRPLWACAKTLTRVMVSRSKHLRRPSPSTATSARPRTVLGLAAPTLQSKAGAPAGPWRLGLCPRVGWAPLSCADRIDANGRHQSWVAHRRRQTCSENLHREINTSTKRWWNSAPSRESPPPATS